ATSPTSGCARRWTTTRRPGRSARPATTTRSCAGTPACGRSAARLNWLPIRRRAPTTGWNSVGGRPQGLLALAPQPVLLVQACRRNDHLLRPVHLLVPSLRLSAKLPPEVRYISRRSQPWRERAGACLLTLSDAISRPISSDASPYAHHH